MWKFQFFICERTIVIKDSTLSLCLLQEVFGGLGDRARRGRESKENGWRKEHRKAVIIVRDTGGGGVSVADKNKCQKQKHRGNTHTQSPRARLPLQLHLDKNIDWQLHFSLIPAGLKKCVFRYEFAHASTLRLAPFTGSCSPSSSYFPWLSLRLSLLALLPLSTRPTPSTTSCSLRSPPRISPPLSLPS